jgi:hypothetical protein
VAFAAQRGQTPKGECRSQRYSIFKVDQVYIESLDPKIMDMKLPLPISVREDVPTIDVAILMEKHDIKKKDIFSIFFVNLNKIFHVIFRKS